MSQPENRSATLWGMAAMTGGALLLATNDAITKWLVVDFHAGEIMFYRGIWAFPVLAYFVWRNGGLSTLRLNQPRAVWGRGVVAFAVSILVTLSFINLPLAEAAALIFMSPVFLTALAPLFLKEQVGFWRWAAVLLGFAGAVVMIQPGTDAFNAWVVFPLMAATVSALRDIVTRRMGTSDSAATVMFYTSIVAVIGGAISLPFGDDFGTNWPTLEQWGLFALAGFFVTMAHFLIVVSLQLAAGAVVSPFKYLSLVWSAALGFMVWGDLPGAVKVLGAVMVVASGLLIVYRETRGRGN